jgi:uncharacterized membrane protein
MPLTPGGPAPGSPSASRRTTMVVLAYLWPLAIVPLLASRDDREVSWHAWQGLLLMAAALPLLIVLIGLTALAGLANYSLGVTLGVVVFLVWVAILGVQLTAMVYALNGKRLAVPGLAQAADKLARLRGQGVQGA